MPATCRIPVGCEVSIGCKDPTYCNIPVCREMAGGNGSVYISLSFVMVDSLSLLSTGMLLIDLGASALYLDRFSFLVVTP